jgi:hypothetical protein
VLATSKNMRIAADGTRSGNSYLPTHAFLPAFPAAEASALVGLITTVEPRFPDLDKSMGSSLATEAFRLHAERDHSSDITVL